MLHNKEPDQINTQPHEDEKGELSDTSSKSELPKLSPEEQDEIKAQLYEESCNALRIQDWIKIANLITNSSGNSTEVSDIEHIVKEEILFFTDEDKISLFDKLYSNTLSKYRDNSSSLINTILEDFSTSPNTVEKTNLADSLLKSYPYNGSIPVVIQYVEAVGGNPLKKPQLTTEQTAFINEISNELERLSNPNSLDEDIIRLREIENKLNGFFERKGR